jgi:AcrR family transcriptional regulator
MHMVRITKQPDERRSELLDTAERLFTEHGFASVRVSDIVSAMGVAQGTFYYYYKTKDEVLIALLHQKWQQIAAAISEQVSREQDPAARLSKALALMVMPGDEITSDPYYRLLKDPSVTQAFHPEFDRARIDALLPIMQNTVEYGITKGAIKNFTHTAEIVKMVFLGIAAYFHTVMQEDFMQAVSSVFELTERVTGLLPGTLNIIKR